MLNIVTNGKPVTISGFTFTNMSNQKDYGVGIKAMVNNDQAGTGKEMVIHHCSFRHNKGIALDIDNTAKLGTRMWNILFADGENDAIRLNDSQSMHFVNVTFV